MGLVPNLARTWQLRQKFLLGKVQEGYNLITFPPYNYCTSNWYGPSLNTSIGEPTLIAETNAPYYFGPMLLEQR